MKTASLMAKGCRAASVLGGSTQEVSEIAYTYGRNIGLAFQASELVYQSNGIEQTKLLAASHCQTAINAILKLPESDARNALIQLSQKY
ncbi:unnamed protein product [Rhizophagus irregularis]|nr:unnamed protein product [Rhizophagus irregularis]